MRKGALARAQSSVGKWRITGNKTPEESQRSCIRFLQFNCYLSLYSKLFGASTKPLSAPNDVRRLGFEKQCCTTRKLEIVWNVKKDVRQ